MTAPRPYALLAELTYRCPLHCPYCSNPTRARNDGELTTDEWRRVFREATELGVLQLGFSGGEPLVRRDLAELVRDAREARLYTNLITSGVGLDKSRASELRDVATAAKARLAGKIDIFYVLPDYYETRPKPCLNGWGQRYLTVNPIGDVLPCPTASSAIPDLRLENVRARSLDWIWRRSESFNRFRGTEWMPEPCRSCPQKEIDFGGCRCQAALLTGNAANTDPVCELSPN